MHTEKMHNLHMQSLSPTDYKTPYLRGAVTERGSPGIMFIVDGGEVGWRQQVK